MSWVAVAIGGSALLGLYGANKQAGAAQSASQLQYQATQDAANQQRQMFDILNAQQAPYRQAGTEALTNIKEMLPYFTKQVTAEDLRSMPGFTFGLEQGAGAAGGVGAPRAPRPRRTHRSTGCSTSPATLERRARAQLLRGFVAV